MNYKQKYNKEHYKSFKVDLKKEECEQLEEELKKQGISKSDFLRNAIKEFLNVKRKN